MAVINVINLCWKAIKTNVAFSLLQLPVLLAKNQLASHVAAQVVHLQLLLMVQCRYLRNEGRSINKLQNGTIPWVLKTGKIRNIRFVENLILNIHTTFLDDDVIIVTSSDNRTQSICVSFSPSVYYRNSQAINSIWTTLVCIC